MNKKTLGLGIFGFLALAFMISFASAAITISSIQNPSVYGNSFNVVLTTDQASDEQVTAMTIAPLNDGSGNSIIFNIPAILPLVPTGTSGITVPITYTTGNFNFNYIKTYSTIMTVNGTVSTNNINGDQKTVTFSQRPYCDNVSNNGNLRTEITDVKILSGFGDEDNYWYPLDQIEIKINVDNQGDWDINSIEIRWALYTTAGVKITDDKLSTFKLKEGDEKTLTFTINLDENMDDFDGEDAILLVKAKGKISDENAGVYDNEYSCSSDSKTIEVITDDNFVILKDIIMNGEKLDNKELTLNTALTCGEEITINADVWNIQNSDEDGVIVEIYNKELGIDQEITIGDINSFDSEKLNVQVKISENANEKWYSLLFSVYNEDHDLYENSEDEKAEFMTKIKVANCTSKLIPSLSAQLASEAVAGKELIIKTIITNTGSSTITYNLNIAGYADWANLKNMSATTITLNSGESKEIQIVFETNKESAGDRFFDIEVLANGQFIAKQPVAVSIGESKTSAISDFVVSNWKLLGIILLNLILVIAIIVVIVRLYKK